MGAIFSKCDGTTNNTKKNAAGTISPTDRAILDLKNARDRLNRYKTQLSNDEKKLLTRAKTYQTQGNKNAALHLLRLRHHKLKEASNVDNQLLKVLEMVDTIVGKENERDLIVAMTAGKDALERLHEEMSVDEVMDLMDKIKEQDDVEKEINSIVAQGAGMSVEDEDEVMKELEELELAMRKQQEDEEEANDAAGEKKEEEEAAKDEAGEKKEEEEEEEVAEGGDIVAEDLPVAPSTALLEVVSNGILADDQKQSDAVAPEPLLAS